MWVVWFQGVYVDGQVVADNGGYDTTVLVKMLASHDWLCCIWIFSRHHNELFGLLDWVSRELPCLKENYQHPFIYNSALGKKQREGCYKQSIIRICSADFTPETASPSFLKMSLSCAFVSVLTKATTLWRSEDCPLEAIVEWIKPMRSKGSPNVVKNRNSTQAHLSLTWRLRGKTFQCPLFSLLPEELVGIYSIERRIQSKPINSPQKIVTERVNTGKATLIARARNALCNRATAAAMISEVRTRASDNVMT